MTKNSAFVGNARHFNDEIDFACSEGLVRMKADLHALVLTMHPFSRWHNGTRGELSHHQEGAFENMSDRTCGSPKQSCGLGRI